MPLRTSDHSAQAPNAEPLVKSTPREQAPHVIIVGGGVAGLILATRLGDTLGRRGRARISLIDRSWIHVWKPMLHTFAAGTWNIYQQQVQYLAHARAHHFEYVPGKVDAIDRTARRIRLAPSCESLSAARFRDSSAMKRCCAAGTAATLPIRSLETRCSTRPERPASRKACIALRLRRPLPAWSRARTIAPTKSSKFPRPRSSSRVLQ